MKKENGKKTREGGREGGGENRLERRRVKKLFLALLAASLARLVWQWKSGGVWRASFSSSPFFLLPCSSWREEGGQQATTTGLAERGKSLLLPLPGSSLFSVRIAGQAEEKEREGWGRRKHSPSFPHCRVGRKIEDLGDGKRRRKEESTSFLPAKFDFSFFLLLECWKG